MTILPSVAKAVAAAGKLGIFRYVPLPGNRVDISASEAQVITGAGLQLGLVQHVRNPGWQPSSCDGNNDGAVAAGAAVRAGYPPGAHLFLDLEGIGDSNTAACIEYANRWAESVKSFGLRAGLYVGYNVPMTGDELYQELAVDCYWSDAAGRRVATRGCAVVQGRGVTIGGIGFDEDAIAPDQLGGLPMVCAAAGVNVGSQTLAAHGQASTFPPHGQQNDPPPIDRH